MDVNGDRKGETIWYPADIYSRNPKVHKGLALVILNQPMEIPGLLYHMVQRNSIYTVAADGGANIVHDLNTQSLRKEGRPLTFFGVHSVIGDLDSLRPDVREYWTSNGAEIIQDPYQYSTDFTKAVHFIQDFDIPDRAKHTPAPPVFRDALELLKEKSKGPKDIVCIGGLGGRVDQGLSQLHHLYKFQQEPGYPSGRMFLLSNEAITFVLQAGKHKIKVKQDRESTGITLGKHVGIIPLKEPSEITTKGLEWDVTDWLTGFGGQISTSNHVKDEWAVVETTKDVLFTIDLDVDDPS